MVQHYKFNFKYGLFETLRAISLLPYRLIRRGNISRFSGFFFTMCSSCILMLNNARPLPVDFLLGSEAEALTASSSFSLLHCPAAGGGVADAWGGRCKWEWVVPVCLLHCVHVRCSLRILARAWAYESLRGVSLTGRSDGVAVLGGGAEWGGCAVDSWDGSCGGTRS